MAMSRSVLGACAFALVAVMLLGAASTRGESLGPSWSSTTGLPNNVELQSCVANSDYGNIYCIGGFDGLGYLNTAYYSQISAAGAAGAWSTTTAYPSSLDGQSCVPFSVYIYCVGGYNGRSRTDAVYYAQPKADGLGAWTATTMYPASVELQSCAVYSSYIYCVGGFDGLHYNSTAYYSLLSTSGGMGSWYSTTAYPIGVEGQSCFTYSGYIYCVGGYNGRSGTDSVYYAPLSTSGGIGKWLKAASYPASVYAQSCAVYSGYVYCVGGYSSSGYSGAVYYAPLSLSGGIASWTEAASYPFSIEQQSCATYSGYIYCMGGFNGQSITNGVYRDSIAPVTPTTVTETSTATSTATVTSTVTRTATSAYTVTSASTVTATSTSVETSVSTVTGSGSATATTQGTSSVSTVTLVTTETQTQQGSQLPPFAVSLGIGFAGAIAGMLVALALLWRRQ